MTFDVADWATEKAKYPGVTYSRSTGRFFARLMVGGERKHLGSFTTPEEAAEAYRAARAERPVKKREYKKTGPRARSTVGTIHRFLSACDTNEDGFPTVGQVLETKLPPWYGGHVERYVVKGSGFGEGGWSYITWEGRCRECGAAYETNTSSVPEQIKGITRTCPEHRMKSSPSKKKPVGWDLV